MLILLYLFIFVENYVSGAELDEKLKSGELPFFEPTDETLPLLIEGYQLNKNLEDY